MAELACGGGGAAALRRCGGSGCTAAVRRRCGGSVTAAVRWQPAHTPCHKCANPKRQRGRSKREYRSRRDDAKETPIISCQAIPFEKKKVCLSSTAPCCTFVHYGISGCGVFKAGIQN